jgi:sugar-specific transcriptional regulator TrmB
MDQELINYGLCEKEAKLYILCLKTGEASANRLIGLSGLPRGTAYDILEKLKIKGLISSIIKEKTTFFSANDPEVLVKELEERKTNIQTIIPKLRALKKTIPKAIDIQVFEGFAGVKKILDEVLESCSELIIMGNERDAREIIKHHPQNFRMKRLEKKIKIRNLLEESKIARELKDDKYSHVRYTDELENSKEVLIIYDDVTAHIIMQLPITTIKVISAEYTKTQTILFESMWKQAKK